MSDTRAVEDLLAEAATLGEELRSLEERGRELADRRAVVFGQLREQGVSVRRIATGAGVSHSAVNATLRVRRERSA